MSKKHFIALAKALASVRPLDTSETPARLQWDRCCSGVADVCQIENGLFDRRRFLKACEEW
jgi:hypothetical protein